MSDNKDKKAAEEEVRQSLENLLLNDVPPMPVVAGMEEIANKAQHPSTRSMNFYKVKDDITLESKKILRSIVNFYLSTDMIKKNEYVRYKRTIDEMTLSKLLFSMKTSEHVMIKILEEIDIGNMNPSMIKAFTEIQSQHQSLIKMQGLYMVQMEEAYKKVYEDQKKIDMETGDQPNDIEHETRLPTGEPVKVRGTKDLMRNIRIIVDQSPIEDIQFESLTDPSRRPESPVEGPDIKEDDNTPTEVDDYFN